MTSVNSAEWAGQLKGSRFDFRVKAETTDLEHRHRVYARPDQNSSCLLEILSEPTQKYDSFALKQAMSVRSNRATDQMKPRGTSDSHVPTFRSTGLVLTPARLGVWGMRRRQRITTGVDGGTCHSSYRRGRGGTAHAAFPRLLRLDNSTFAQDSTRSAEARGCSFSFRPFMCPSLPPKPCPDRRAIIP